MRNARTPFENTSALEQRHSIAPAKITDFANDLAFSHAATETELVWNAVKTHFPSALQIHKCHLENDKRGADIYVELIGGDAVLVDIKVRRKDFSFGKRNDIDVAVELTYNDGPGWACKETIAERFLIVCSDTGRSACFDAGMFQAAVARHAEHWCQQFRVLENFTGGFGRLASSTSVIVPEGIIAQAIRHLDDWA